MKKGVFITFEGIEGCGKSTQLKLAAQSLKAQGYAVCSTREPGGTGIGTQIRRILLSENSAGLSPLSEALLYMADRFQHIQDVIRPALERGEIVLCDRYHDSTIAYQGYARNIPLSLLHGLWEQSGSSLDPDLTLLFDLEPAIGLERSLRKLAAENIDESRFEKEALDFHSRVRNGFLTLMKNNPHRILLIDANKSIESIQNQVMEILTKKLTQGVTRSLP
jgi:dTMP kinase